MLTTGGVRTALGNPARRASRFSQFSLDLEHVSAAAGLDGDLYVHTNVGRSSTLKIFVDNRRLHKIRDTLKQSWVTDLLRVVFFGLFQRHGV